MTPIKKPYLIIPLLIEQPTWGGAYISEKKGWNNKPELAGKKFGQSYELYGKSMLAAEITSTEDDRFTPQLTNTIPVSEFQENRPLPLIKFTQAKGNSFQLHIKPETKEPYWQPKAESWYFLENGKITFGVKKGADIQKYKQTCYAIEIYMRELSKKLMHKEITREQAEQLAQQFITAKNPWQFVNVHTAQKGDVVDLSGGGLHHSWEDDPSHPLGNIVYEVQQDVMDSVSTLRSFDQGKFMSNGSIREIQIEKYFEFLDTDEKRNTLVTKKHTDQILFDTPHYSFTSLSLITKKDRESTTSFHHLFVQEGKISIVDAHANVVTVGRGHSCFIPQGVEYTMKPLVKSELLLTFLR